MNTENNGTIGKIIESFDHILWEAIAKICEEAISKSFHSDIKTRQARIAYKTKKDPRKCFAEILKEIELMISQDLLIEKEQIEEKNLEKICSRKEYYSFFKSSRSDFRECEVVKIGNKICCPCGGQHLKSTGNLRKLEIKINEPVKIGKDTYEFRFSIA